MSDPQLRFSPGRVRDAIVEVLTSQARPLSVKEIVDTVRKTIGPAPASSIRSYLRLNTPSFFVREDRGVYGLRTDEPDEERDETPRKRKAAAPVAIGKSLLYSADCFEWLAARGPNSIHAVVTDPPYGLHEYTPEQQQKLREGKGGVWRIPPSFDGHVRAPLPRFTTLTPPQLEELHAFFFKLSSLLLPVLVPGANVIVASNPLVSYIVSDAMAKAGLERRGEIIRLTMTMRGGDRPKAAHNEFPGVSVMPRSMWEPWVVFRKPIEGRVQDNLRKWKTGGFRRPSAAKPFGDVIESAPTRASERRLAPHPSLKPQAFLRQIVRAVLPMGEGIVLDPFAGSGSTLAAVEAVGYSGIGIEKDERYFEMAVKAIPKLARYGSSGPMEPINPVFPELFDSILV